MTFALVALVGALCFSASAVIIIKGGVLRVSVLSKDLKSLDVIVALIR